MSLRLAAVVFAGGVGLGLLVYLPMRRDLRSLGRQFGIDRWVAWSCYVLSVAGVASVTAAGGSLPENEFLTVGLWAVYFPGWFGLAYAASNYGLYRRLDGTPRTSTGAVSPDAGRVAVSGTATPVDATATTPLFGEHAVCYTWSVEEHRRLPRVGWYTAGLGQGRVPFRVDDGSGRLLVVPDGAELRLAAGISSRQVDADETPPADAVEFLATEGVGFDPTETTHRYEERYVPEGETVYVLGTARSPDPRAYPTETALVDRGDPFVVGTGPVEQATGRLGRTIRAAGAGGAAAVVLGYLGQLLAAGVTPV